MTLTRLKNIILLLVITTLSAVVVMSNLPTLSKRSTGSFEYVRKGEDLLDKGRYGQAIKYFEQALDAGTKKPDIDDEELEKIKKRIEELKK